MDTRAVRIIIDSITDNKADRFIKDVDRIHQIAVITKKKAYYFFPFEVSET